MKQTYRYHLIVIGLYTLLALIFTWPLVSHLPTHIPGEATWAFDESTFIWNMWWFKHSLLVLGQHPLFTDYLFYPLGIHLTTYTFNLFNAAFGLPLQVALSLPLANNLTLLFSYVSSAYGMFLLARYVLSAPPGPPEGGTFSSSSQGGTFGFSPPPGGSGPKLSTSPRGLAIGLAAFIAGTVFAFSASRMMYVALGHYNFVTIQWFPFYTLFLLKTLRWTTFKNILLTALFAAFCLYAELTYSVFLLFLTLIILVGYLAASWRADRVGFVTAFFSLAAVALITFLLTAPFVLSVLPDFLDPAYAEPGWGEGLKLSADLVGLVTLTPLHPLSGLDWVTELRDVIEGRSRFSDANTLFLGYGILALALIGLLRYYRRGRVWLWSVIIFTILSLGPLLTINGQNRFDLDGIEATFPLPFALLHYIPIINANRVPNRFGIPLTLALAILVAYGAAWLLTKALKVTQKKQRTTDDGRRTQNYALRPTPYATIFTLSALLLLTVMFDQYSVPLSLTDARTPEVYHQIGAEEESFALMQLPLGWRNSYGTLGAERTQLQYYQAAHRRPMLGGNTSRNPDFKFDYYANIPLFRALTETELYRPVDEATLEQARAQAAELMTLYDIKYLVIHDPIPRRLPYLDTAQATRTLALDLIPHQPEPVYTSPGVQAFAVEQAPIPDPLTIDLGTDPATPYRGQGWAGNEEIFAATANWVTASEARLFFPVRGGGDRHLSLDIAPFSYPDMPPQAVSLSLNGQPLLDNVSLHEGWQAVEATLPATLLTEGLNELTLHFAHTAQPRQVLPTNTSIGGTGLETPVDLEVNSSFDFAFITVGFGPHAVDASAHRRGLNLTVIDPQSGQVVEIKGFDTAANEFEAAALVEFVQSIPTGHIVVVASQSAEATDFLTAEAQAALAGLGLDTATLQPPVSAIGVKEAAPGTALQTGGGDGGTAYLRLGGVPDTRWLAAAVDKVTLSK